MSSKLELRAEVVKLERLLGCDADGLAFLDKCTAQDVRRLRDQATDVLFDTDRPTMQRMAGASRLLPAPALAAIGERAFGPLLCARVAGLLDPGRAIDVARRLPPTFLADVAVELDPRRTTAALARIPTAEMLPVMRELLRRGELVTLGRFVGHLRDETIRAVLDEVDDQTLLRIAFVAEDKKSLDHIVALLPSSRISGLITAAATVGLWAEALDLVSHLRPKRQAEIADLAASEDDAALEGLVRAAQRDELWDAVLPMLRHASPESRERFAGLAAVHDPAVLDAIVLTAAEEGMWDELAPLAALLPARAQKRIDKARAQLDKR